MLKVLPGQADKATESPGQMMVADAAIVQVGFGFTMTRFVSFATHPMESVMVRITTYVAAVSYSFSVTGSYDVVLGSPKFQAYV